VLAGRVCDVAAERVLAGRQSVDREGKQPEMMAITAVPIRRARAAITGFLDIIHGLTKAMSFGVLCVALR
jgi:hypothetical protein